MINAMNAIAVATAKVVCKPLAIAVAGASVGSPAASANTAPITAAPVIKPRLRASPSNAETTPR